MKKRREIAREQNRERERESLNVHIKCTNITYSVYMYIDKELNVFVESQTYSEDHTLES